MELSAILSLKLSINKTYTSNLAVWFKHKNIHNIEYKYKLVLTFGQVEGICIAISKPTSWAIPILSTIDGIFSQSEARTIRW